MAKVKYSWVVWLFLTVLCTKAYSQQYPVRYLHVDSAEVEKLGLSKTFPNRFDANSYLAGLLPFLKTKGYVTASIDSLAVDSTEATVVLFLGEQYRWSVIKTEEKG